jgi:N-acetylneuraminic acid mutarotase
MATSRSSHTATVLPSGKVLVVGGWDDTVPVSSAELYDPATNTWSRAASMVIARAHHTATLLASGKVLVSGGWNNGSTLASAELYDPVTDTWSPAGSMASPRGGHTATLLSSGKVLVAGGDGGGFLNYLASVELYDPGTNTWSTTAPMAIGRRSHSASLLPDGQVLVVGGETTYGDPIGGGATYSRSAELYDPATNRWSPAASMALGRTGHVATSVPGGQVLVTGSDLGSISPSTELYEAKTNTWSTGGDMAIGRVGHSATLLNDGRVLVAGDWNNGVPLASAELYLPSPTGLNGKLPATGAGPGNGNERIDALVFEIALLLVSGVLLVASHRVLP